MKYTHKIFKYSILKREEILLRWNNFKSSTKRYNFTVRIRKFPRPKLFFSEPAFTNTKYSFDKPRKARNITAKSNDSTRVRQGKGGKVYIWKSRHAIATTYTISSCPPCHPTGVEPASLILESVSNPRRTTILAFSPRYSILIFPTSWCGCHKRSLCRPQNVQQHVSERSSNPLFVRIFT